MFGDAMRGVKNNWSSGGEIWRGQQIFYVHAATYVYLDVSVEGRVSKIVFGGWGRGVQQMFFSDFFPHIDTGPVC